MQANALIEKIQALPPERLAEVEDFVDFIRMREQQLGLTRAAATASVPAFAAVWDNPDDDVYDALRVRRYRPGAISIHRPDCLQAKAGGRSQQPRV